LKFLQTMVGGSMAKMHQRGKSLKSIRLGSGGHEGGDDVAQMARLFEHTNDFLVGSFGISALVDRRKMLDELLAHEAHTIKAIAEGGPARASELWWDIINRLNQLDEASLATIWREESFMGQPRRELVRQFTAALAQSATKVGFHIPRVQPIADPPKTDKGPPSGTPAAPAPTLPTPNPGKN
jgi:hypothetical protein